MYECWLIISDVGGAPDYLGKWPKLAVAHVKAECRIGSPCLGNVTFCMTEKAKEEVMSAFDQFSFESITCAIQFFNDNGNDYPPSRGTIAHLNVQPLYGDVCPVQLSCDEISEAEFGTHIAFDTLPELEVIPLKNKT